MRCPRCQARNPDDAAWCGQCLTALTPPPDRDPTGATAADRGAPLQAAPVAPDRGVRPLAAGGGRFRQTPAGVEWACSRCGSWNDLAPGRCATCGAALGGDVDGPVTTAPVAAPATATAATALLPGLGHVLGGRPGTGLARMVLWLLWGAGGVGLVVAASGSDQSSLPGVVLLLGAAAVWAASLVDVRALVAGRRREILDVRTLLWLVVAVVGLLTVAFLVTALRLPG